MPFTCDECVHPSKFATRSALKQHKTLHSGPAIVKAEQETIKNTDCAALSDKVTLQITPSKYGLRQHKKYSHRGPGVPMYKQRSKKVLKSKLLAT